MADKDFGVKRINLIGAIGTPTITSPTDLIINANKVGISTNLTVGGSIGIGTTIPSQKLHVQGTAYVSSNVGVAVTSPSFAVDVSGDTRIQSTGKMRFGGTSGTTNFYIQYNSTSNSLDFVVG